MRVSSKSPAAPASPTQAAPTTPKGTLTRIATQAAAQVVASTPPGTTVTSQHPLLSKFGEALGVGLGVVVTEALRAVPSWNTPVLDANGQQAASIPGATREGDVPLLKRHEEVVGPQIAALVAKMPDGAVKDLLSGFAAGATEAPGDSYRLEARFKDGFDG